MMLSNIITIIMTCHLQVREYAEKFALPTSTRKDSQGICFLGKLKFEEFIGHYLGEQPGEVRCYQTSKLLGHHKGLWFHTVGQRKGLGPLLFAGTVNLGPWFVARKDVASNTLYITNQMDVVEGPRKAFAVNRVNWISGEPPEGLHSDAGVRLLIQLRHGPNNANPGTVRLATGSSLGSSSTNPHLQDGLAPDVTLTVELDRRDRSGIAEGQFAAFYRNEVCLGAGVICGAVNSIS